MAEMNSGDVMEKIVVDEPLTSDSDSDADFDFGETVEKVEKKGPVEEEGEDGEEMEDLDDIDDEGEQKSAMGAVPHTKNELVGEEIPVPENRFGEKLPESEETRFLGKIVQIVDNCVVCSHENGEIENALDEGSYLCFEDKTILGCVDEVFGKIERPFYSVRFALNGMPQRCLESVGCQVFVVLNSALFVQVAAIRDKGSDASGLYDEEPAAEDVEFSDDEEEAKFRAERRERKRAARGQPPQDDHMYVPPPELLQQQQQAAPQYPVENGFVQMPGGFTYPAPPSFFYPQPGY